MSLLVIIIILILIIITGLLLYFALTKQTNPDKEFTPIENTNSNQVQTSHTGDKITFTYYHTSLENAVNFVKDVLDSVLSSPLPAHISSDTRIYTYEINLGNFTDGTLGTFYAKNETTGVINIGNNLNNQYFNDTTQELKSIVLLHEVLHGLGIGTKSTWNGANARTKYNDIINTIFGTTTYNKDVPIEDSGGSGTTGYHYEETEVVGSADHYIIPGEIMTGYLNQSNYLTNLTIGSLLDLGFSINSSSPYIFTNLNTSHIST